MGKKKEFQFNKKISDVVEAEWHRRNMVINCYSHAGVVRPCDLLAVGIFKSGVNENNTPPSRTEVRWSPLKSLYCWLDAASNRSANEASVS